MIQIKIGLCGTNGRGKTTKSLDLMEHYTFLGNKVTIVDEVARECTYALGTIEAQEEIWAMQMSHEKYAMTQDVDVVICNSTVMDNLMYYCAILKNGGVYTGGSKWVRWWDLYHEAVEWMSTYTQVIRLPINLEWIKIEDEIRPKDVAYVRRIDALFDKFVQPYVKDE